MSDPNDEPYVMPSWEDAAQVDTVTTAGTSVPCIGSWINTRVCERGTKGCEMVHGADTFRHVRAKEDEMPEERRVPCQGEGPYYLADDNPRRVGFHCPGTVAWSEHVEAYAGYAKRFPLSAAGQDAERVARRGGFGYGEMTEYMGHEPRTWQVHRQFASRKPHG